MSDLDGLFRRNKQWSERIKREQPDFFARLAAQQTPEYLWIGCADSRVPANQIVDLMPGELFVHRNVSNLVVHTDMNCLSVIQYAVEVLKVKHIMVVGHYGCGGVRAALSKSPLGMIDNWLRHIKDVYLKHRTLIGVWQDSEAQLNQLCELNVIEQAVNVCNTTFVQEAWHRKQPLTVHGWIYGLSNGQVKDLGFEVQRISEIDLAEQQAIEGVRAHYQDR